MVDWIQAKDRFSYAHTLFAVQNSVTRKILLHWSCCVITPDQCLVIKAKFGLFVAQQQGLPIDLWRKRAFISKIFAYFYERSYRSNSEWNQLGLSFCSQRGDPLLCEDQGIFDDTMGLHAPTKLHDHFNHLRSRSGRQFSQIRDFDGGGSRSSPCLLKMQTFVHYDGMAWLENWNIWYTRDWICLLKIMFFVFQV